MRLRIGGTLSLLVYVLLLLLPAVAQAQESTPHKRVLVIYWYNKDHPWNTEFDQSFQATLQSAPEGNVETYSEYLESNRFPGENQSLVLRDYLKQKYADRGIDVVVATSDASLNFLLKYRDGLFPNAPVVFVAAQSPSKEILATGPGLTGIITLKTHRENLDLARSLHPGTMQVFIVSGTLERDKRFETLAKKELQGYESKVELVYLTDLSLEELIAKVKALPERSIVFHVWQQSRNESGKVLEHSEMLGPIARSSTVPVYAMNFLTVFSQSEHSIAGSGVVGGVINTAEASGTRVAEIALRIASGVRANDIPIEAAPTVQIFDWRELRRWGINESQLPARSIVRFKEPTLWEHYKWRIIGAISLIILQALLIIGLLINRSKRRQAEKDSERFGELARAEHRRLDEVVSNIPGLVWEVSIDPASGKRKTEFVSRYVEQLLGYRPEDFEGRTGFGSSLIPEEDRERVERETNDVLSGRTSGAIQFQWLTKDGRPLWVESQMAPILNESGKPIGLRGVTMDITERKHTEESLRESEHRFQLVSDATKDILYEWNLQTGVVWWNDSAMRSVFGYPLEEMTHDFNWWEERLHPEDKDRINASVTEVLAGLEQKWENEYRFRKMDNSYAYVYHRAFIIRDEEGQALKAIGSLMDFSERKQYEERLRCALEEVSLLKNQLQEENIYLQEEIKLAHNVDEIIGRSNAIKYVLFKIEQVGQTDSTVMILGETGTGKELVARAIHSQSMRKDRPLVKVNCAALSAGLIESELFGHEKGSFTGALARKIGRFELADGATLFLDEIGELPLDLQSKLLRVIQEGEFERLGSSKTIKVDVRIIAATNRNMKAEVEKGAFREDLWYRLNVFPITIPPLRQRKEDIPPMVEHFVSSLSRKVGKDITAVSSATLKKLQDYSWPGNVRELANVIERGVINAQGSVLHLTDQFEQPKSQELAGPSKTLDEIEKEYITRILADTAWKIEGPNGAARILGLNPSTLRTRMVKLGIQKSAQKSAQG